MDPKAEKFYGMSPYTYCAGNPVNLVDEKGYNWYLFFDKEGKEQYRYYEGKLTEEEVKQGGYRDLGFTYSSKTDYYSLFGRKLSYSSKDGLIAQLYKNIDNLIITYFTNSSDADGRIRHVDMSLKEKGLISFSYNGLSFSSIKGVGPGHSAIGDGTLFYSVDTKNAQSYIIRFPEKETALASYHRKFKGYWLLAANGIGSNEGFLTLQIKFDRTNACRFLKSVNHLFGKNYTFE